MAKPPKYPKSLGACADLLYVKRQERLEADRYAAALKAEENLLAEHIINNLNKGDTGAVGQTHKVTVNNVSTPRVVDWDLFWAFVLKRKATFLLQRRITETAVQELMNDPKLKGGVPGVEPFVYPKISLTKR